MFTSGANIADYVFLLARTNPDVPKHQGLTTFMVPLKSVGVTVQPVYTFQDERTNITYYDGVKIPDSYRLGAVDGGVVVMAASLEMEHGGGYGKTLEMMLRAAETLCREILVHGHPLIEDRSAQRRLARTAAHAAISTALNSRALWASVEKKTNPAFGPMAKLFSTENFLSDSADLLNLTAPISLSKRSGPAAFLNQCYRHGPWHENLWRHERGSSQPDSGTKPRPAENPQLNWENRTVSDAPHLLVNEDGPILIATLNRPEKLNALSGQMLELFEAALHRYRDTPALKVMLIRATGRYFCAGADLFDHDESDRGVKRTGSADPRNASIAHARNAPHL